MSDPNSAIPEHVKPALWRRYEDWRVRRYEGNLVKHAARWPGLRNRRSYRRLVVALAVMQALFVASTVIAFFSVLWFMVPFVVAIGGAVGVLVTLRIVTGSVADAPVGALDEIQLAQRNSARSIGFIVVFSLAFIPYLLLVFMGSGMDYVKGQNVYGIGVLLVALIFIGACVPTMLTAWWMTDPDPDDFADDDESAEATAAEPDSALTPAPARTSADNLDPPTPAPW